ncbi:AI-2E family transporter [Anaerocolumna sp. MB42-C2]|uniref:AI-2E family transporter n=1 Tax=Anaerocolumna sp. MB42-C2 TaxID=3070997 RepID=UPI0027E0C058|nr:AI-2E family transporter [Anaerocolumna sp. MB42-C2]WMJ89776.1 AI-2E family transporter [Anaerocolumna sp. MB42-C2]
MGTAPGIRPQDLSENEEIKSTELTDITADEKKESKMQFQSNRNYLTISIYALFVIVTGAFIIYSFVNMKQTKLVISDFLNTISPFLAAFLIAFIINPLVLKLQDFSLKVLRIKSRAARAFLSIFISYLLVIGGLTITILYVTPQLIQSISDIVSKQSLIYDEITKWISGLYERYPDLNLGAVVTYIDKMVPDLIGRGTEVLSNMIPKLYLLSISLIKMFVNILLSIVISCYMILDKKNLRYNAKRFIYSIMPSDRAKGFIQTGKDCADIFNKFIVGKMIDSLLIGIICVILMILLRLPYPILMSVIVGITNMIPYFGPFIGAVPGVVIYLFLNPIQCLIFIVMILILQQFDGLYLGPRILGESTGLKPLWIIFAITLGGAYAGVIGMFLAVPVIAVFTYLLDKFIKRRLEQKNISIQRDKD